MEIMNKELIKKVHVVFMTHLDMGFTDFADCVLERYRKEFIPAAIELAKELNQGGKKKFVWTLGAFLVDQILREDGSGGERLSEAIKRGDICWHGLAFTTHTELMDQDLMHFDLSYADKLDQKFGKCTMAAKLTDVPGHTKAMVPILSEHGKKYLHVGVNASSMTPKVPMSFLWETKKSEIIVQYSQDYGDTCYVEGMDEVLEFVFMGDNMGIPTREQILLRVESLENTYPNALVEASGLDDYAMALWQKRELLPKITEEIGDTWIHGIASDPVKVSRFKRLLSLKDRWKSQGIFRYDKEEFFGFMENLLLVCEHTWGLDMKKHLFDFKNWRKEDFLRAREENLVTEELFTDRNAALLGAVSREKGSEHFKSSYEAFESSHKEQRNYLDMAIRQLPKQQQKEALAELEFLEGRKPWGELLKEELHPKEEVHPFEIQKIKGWKVSFDGSGSIIYLEKDQKIWLHSGCLGRFSYETYSALDCITEYYEYNHAFEQNMKWSEADFSKPGLETVEELVSKNYSFGAETMRISGDSVMIELTGNPMAVSEYGCPMRAKLLYTFDEELKIRLSWEKKDANRMPEALWFDMNLDVENPFLWKMVIMDSEISPLKVAGGGNRRQHCVEKMQYDGAEGSAEIRSLDAPLVSIGGRRLYGGCMELPDLKLGFSYCLFNNKWGTNFPMWCEEDCRFDFCLELKNK